MRQQAAIAACSARFIPQVIKRGVTEMADIVVINKADGATRAAASRAATAFKSTVHFHRQRRQSWQPAVLTASAHTGLGIDKLQQHLIEYEAVMLHSGELAQVGQPAAPAVPAVQPYNVCTVKIQLGVLPGLIAAHLPSCGA